MSSDRRVVYSTESGRLDKTVPGKKVRGRRTEQQSAVATRPSKQGVCIRRESKGRGGKVVSIIDGLPLDQTDLKALLKKLKGKLGTGGAVKQGVLEIQGEHREKLLELLAAEGYKAKLSGG